ncbi:MAG: response regulator [Lachnospiraceae bacterium]|nr:response regulator [Lachnospiraceae bacterium]
MQENDNQHYSVLIADDEPLVQIGLKTMFTRDFPDFEIVSGVNNGKEALKQIEELRPDIVISDIKMPLMTGLELIETVRERFGELPVFIMLTAFEDFDMARKALENEACDYLVKIELTPESLLKALQRASKRVLAARKEHPKEHTELSFQEGFRQRCILKLLNRQFPNITDLLKEASENHLDFSYNRYILVYGEIEEHKGDDTSKGLSYYSSCFTMTKEIVSKHAPCYPVSVDPRHFAFIFYFSDRLSVADAMEQINDALENALEMIDNYFNAALFFGIGSAVTDPLEIPDSFEESMAAIKQADKSGPIRLFSHIVGSNRRSGKDRLISSIQEYIEQNLDGKLKLNEVAEVFGLSPAYLSSIFKKNSEIGFSEFVYTRKIEKAKSLLLSGDMRMYEVADALGFESAYYFSKVFKRVTGMSPRDYVNSKL